MVATPLGGRAEQVPRAFPVRGGMARVRIASCGHLLAFWGSYKGAVGRDELTN